MRSALRTVLQSMANILTVHLPIPTRFGTSGGSEQ
jgi:hypothetical protein